MSGPSPYNALYELFGHDWQTQNKDNKHNIKIIKKSAKKHKYVTKKPLKIDNSCQTQPLCDYSYNKVVKPSKKKVAKKLQEKECSSNDAKVHKKKTSSSIGMHLKTSHVNAVYKTVSEIEKFFRDERDLHLHSRKCLCSSCGALGVITESMKHPVDFDDETTETEEESEGTAVEDESESCYNIRSGYNNRSRKNWKVEYRDSESFRYDPSREGYIRLLLELDRMVKRVRSLEQIALKYDLPIKRRKIDFAYDLQTTHQKNPISRKLETSTSSTDIRGPCGLFSIPNVIRRKFSKKKCIVEKPANQTTKPSLRSKTYRAKENDKSMKNTYVQVDKKFQSKCLDEKLHNFDLSLLNEDEICELMYHLKNNASTKPKQTNQRTLPTFKDQLQNQQFDSAKNKHSPFKMNSSPVGLRTIDNNAMHKSLRNDQTFIRKSANYENHDTETNKNGKNIFRDYLHVNDITPIEHNRQNRQNGRNHSNMQPLRQNFLCRDSISSKDSSIYYNMNPSNRSQHSNRSNKSNRSNRKQDIDDQKHDNVKVPEQFKKEWINGIITKSIGVIEENYNHEMKISDNSIKSKIGKTVTYSKVNSYHYFNNRSKDKENNNVPIEIGQPSGCCQNKSHMVQINSNDDGSSSSEGEVKQTGPRRYVPSIIKKPSQSNQSNVIRANFCTLIDGKSDNNNNNNSNNEPEVQEYQPEGPPLRSELRQQTQNHSVINSDFICENILANIPYEKKSNGFAIIVQCSLAENKDSPPVENTETKPQENMQETKEISDPKTAEKNLIVISAQTSKPVPQEYIHEAKETDSKTAEKSNQMKANPYCQKTVRLQTKPKKESIGIQVTNSSIHQNEIIVSDVHIETDKKSVKISKSCEANLCKKPKKFKSKKESKETQVQEDEIEECDCKKDNCTSMKRASTTVQTERDFYSGNKPKLKSSLKKSRYEDIDSTCSSSSSITETRKHGTSETRKHGTHKRYSRKKPKANVKKISFKDIDTKKSNSKEGFYGKYCGQLSFPSAFKSPNVLKIIDPEPIDNENLEPVDNEYLEPIDDQKLEPDKLPETQFDFNDDIGTSKLIRNSKTSLCSKKSECLVKEKPQITKITDPKLIDNKISSDKIGQRKSVSFINNDIDLKNENINYFKSKSKTSLSINNKWDCSSLTCDAIKELPEDVSEENEDIIEEVYECPLSYIYNNIPSVGLNTKTLTAKRSILKTYKRAINNSPFQLDQNNSIVINKYKKPVNTRAAKKVSSSMIYDIFDRKSGHVPLSSVFKRQSIQDEKIIFPSKIPIRISHEKRPIDQSTNTCKISKIPILQKLDIGTVKRPSLTVYNNKYKNRKVFHYNVQSNVPALKTTKKGSSKNTKNVKSKLVETAYPSKIPKLQPVQNNNQQKGDNGKPETITKPPNNIDNKNEKPLNNNIEKSAKPLKNNSNKNIEKPTKLHITNSKNHEKLATIPPNNETVNKIITLPQNKPFSQALLPVPPPNLIINKNDTPLPVPMCFTILKEQIEKEALKNTSKKEIPSKKSQLSNKIEIEETRKPNIDTLKKIEHKPISENPEESKVCRIEPNIIKSYNSQIDKIQRMKNTDDTSDTIKILPVDSDIISSYNSQLEKVERKLAADDNTSYPTIDSFFLQNDLKESKSFYGPSPYKTYASTCTFTDDSNGANFIYKSKSKLDSDISVDDSNFESVFTSTSDLTIKKKWNWLKTFNHRVKSFLSTKNHKSNGKETMANSQNTCIHLPTSSFEETTISNATTKRKKWNKFKKNALKTLPKPSSLTFTLSLKKKKSKKIK